ncbi:hypothetical protein AVEN_43529-1, partial [Araneus ventricosus]
MMSKDCGEFDLVIFGASGLTGRYAVEELARSVVRFPEIRWAVAGRNAEKLKETLAIVQEYLSDEIEVKSTQIILADTKDPTSIYQMCKRTKLLLNCVGPRRNGSFNLCRMQDALHRYQRRDQGGLNSVEYFSEFNEGPTGKPIGCGTYLSLAHSLLDYFKPSKFEKEVEEKVFRKLPTKLKLPKNKYDDFRDLSMTYNYKESAWCIKYFGPNERNIKRSQMIRASYLNSEEY